MPELTTTSVSLTVDCPITGCSEKLSSAVQLIPSADQPDPRSISLTLSAEGLQADLAAHLEAEHG